MVWIVGPLSGLIVAPLVGTLSDQCTSRYGRRRPFIIGGLIATISGMLLFSNAIEISLWFFAHGTSQQRWTAIAIAIVAFCILDLAINTTMWPGMCLHHSSQLIFLLPLLSSYMRSDKPFLRMPPGITFRQKFAHCKAILSRTTNNTQCKAPRSS